MKVGVNAQTGLYDSVVGAVLFGSGAVVLWALGAGFGAGVVAVVVAALLNVAIHAAIPSPEAEADQAKIARLEAKAAQLGRELANRTPEAFAGQMNRREGVVKAFGSRDSYIR